MKNKKVQGLGGGIGEVLWDFVIFLMEKLCDFIYWIIKMTIEKVIDPQSSKPDIIKKLNRDDLKNKKTTIREKAIGYSVTQEKDLEDIDKRKHTLVCGASGFGKTVLLDTLMFDDMQKGRPVIFIDPKGDNESLVQFISLCRIAEREFEVFSEYYEGPGKISLNPVKDGSFTHVADRIHQSFDWSDEHYETLCYSALLESCQLLVKEKKTLSYENIHKKLIHLSYSKFTPKDIQGIIMRIEKIIHSDFGKILKDDGLSFDEIWKSKKCIYIGTPILGYPVIAKALGRIILSDLSYAVYNTYRNVTHKKASELSPMGVYIDELSAVITDNFIELLNKCRGAKMELTFAFQSPADLEKVNPHLCLQILENTSNWFVFKQRVEAGANLFSEAIGTMDSIKKTVRTEKGKEMDLGSQRDVQELLVHHNIIKNLELGQAVLLQHNPTRIDLVNVKYIDPEIVKYNVEFLEENEFIPKIFEEYLKENSKSESKYKFLPRSALPNASLKEESGLFEDSNRQDFSVEENEVKRELSEFQKRNEDSLDEENKHSDLNIKEEISTSDITILEEIGTWKAIFLNDLYEKISAGKGFSWFCKIIKKLQNLGYIESKKQGSNGKALFLSKQSHSLFKIKGFGICEHLNHDLICTKVIKEMVKNNMFKSGYVPRPNEYEIDPDGILFTIKDNLKIALEIELTQKDKKRVEEKFKKYSDEKDIQEVIYIFREESIFDKYQRILMHLDENIQKKITLNFDNNLSITKYSPLTSIWSPLQKKVSS